MTEFRPSRFQILPPVIKNLVIINGLVFLAQNTLENTIPFDDLFALHTWQSSLFKPWQLVTHLFMHGGISHILLNMLALWMFGSVLENVWGSKRFLTFYMICGLGAALIHLLFLNWELLPMINDYTRMAEAHMSGSPDQANFMIHFIEKNDLLRGTDSVVRDIQAHSQDPVYLDNVFDQISLIYNKAKLDTPTLGASGAIFGVLAAFGYLFPNTYLYIYALFPIKAKWAVIIYAGIELIEGVRNSAGDNVAHWAHLGGGLVGLLIVMTWNKTNKKTFY